MPSFDFAGLGNLLVVYGIKLTVAIVIAIVGWTVSGIVGRVTRRALMSTSHMDPTVGAFLSSLVYYALLVITFIVILQVVGIQATSLVAVLGAASLAIGLALQGTLSNMAAGVMLLIFRPFRLGDTIDVAGQGGTVKNLNLFMTELASGDNVQVLIPNGKVWGAPITNLSAYKTRRLNVTVPVPFARDPNAVAARVRKHLEQDRRVLRDPPPSIDPVKVTDAVVELNVEAWTQADEVGAVRADLHRRLVATVQAPSEQPKRH